MSTRINLKCVFQLSSSGGVRPQNVAAVHAIGQWMRRSTVVSVGPKV